MVLASQAPNRYGAELASWLAKNVDPEYAGQIMQGAADVLCDLFDGNEPRDVAPEVRAALCSVWDLEGPFAREGHSLEWVSQLAVFGIDYTSEWYVLAVLAIPNLSQDDIRALVPFRNGVTVGIAQAVRNHPSVDDDLMVAEIYRTWNGTENPPSLHFGALAELARHSLKAKVAAVITSYGVGGEDGVPVEAYWEAVTIVSSEGPQVAEYFASLLNDYFSTPASTLNGEQLVGIARSCGAA